MDLDAARDRFTTASKAAQDALLDLMNAQKVDDPPAVRAALAGYVDLQSRAVHAHAYLASAARRHQVADDVRDRLEDDHQQMLQQLAAAEDELTRHRHTTG